MKETKVKKEKRMKVRRFVHLSTVLFSNLELTYLTFYFLILKKRKMRRNQIEVNGMP